MSGSVALPTKDGLSPDPAKEAERRPASAGAEGFVERIGADYVTGWARISGSTERVEVELVAGDKIIASGIADQFRPDLAAAGKGDGYCAFKIALPEGADHSGPIVARVKDGPLLRRLLPKGPEAEAAAPTAAASKPAGAVEGFVERLASDLASGWAWIPGTADRVEVEVVANGKLLGSGVADHLRADLAAAGKGDGRHAFKIAIATDVPFDERTWSVRVKGGRALKSVRPEAALAEPPKPQPAPQPTKAVEGFVERWTKDLVAGWARIPGSPERLGIEVVSGGTVIASGIADRLRPDLIAANKGDGRCAFLIYLPPGAPFDEAATVRVRGGVALRVLPGAHRQPASSPEGGETRTTPPPTPAQLSTPATVKFRLERIKAGKVIGWAFDPAEPQKRQRVTLHIDGAPAAEATADIHRADLQRNGIGDGRHSFEILVPAAFLDDQPHRYQISIEGVSGLHPASPAVHTLPRRRASVVTVEKFNGPRLTGWGWNQDAPGVPLSLNVTIDGRLVDRVTCNAFRSDLKKAGIRDGFAAWEYRVPQRFLDDREHTLALALHGDASDWPGYRTTFRLPPPFDGIGGRFGAGQILFAGEVEPDPQQIKGRLPAAVINVIEGIGIIDAFTTDAERTTVIIPVYNAFEDVRRCLDSVIRHTGSWARILVLDDASPDPRVHPLLVEFAALCPNIRVQRNDANLGYTRNINSGVAICPGDVVLLNSDTIVTPRWLEKLRAAAYRRQRIGTVTAVSNNAGAFSVPEMNQPNRYPAYLTAAQVGRAVAAASPGWAPSVPTGNGFCLYIKRRLIEDVGAFDEEKFPRGYGEENDFCLRALRRGWEHIIDDTTLVIHERSRSFKGERSKLLEAAQRTIAQSYPEYSHLTRVFGASPQLREARSAVRAVLEEMASGPQTLLDQPHQTKPRILYVIHQSSDGGTTLTNEDLMRLASQDFSCLMLTSDIATIRLFEFTGGESKLIGLWRMNEPATYINMPRLDYAAVFSTVLVRYSIELVHIRHLLRSTLELPAVANALNIPVIMSFHDFYYICPTVNLIDENGVYCAGQCTASQGECKTPTPWPERMPPLKHNMVHRWRDDVRALFPHVSAFVTTCVSARDLYLKHFPELESADFRVIEHGRDFPEQACLAAVPSADEPIRLLMTGHLTSRHKGGEVVKRLKALDRAGRLELHFLGNTSEEYAEYGVLHGRYKRDELPRHVAEIRPSFVGLFTIWPETYSHTLSEAWACGVPVLGSDLGAIGNRLRKHGGGWVVDCTNVEAIYALILDLARDPVAYRAQEGRARIGNLRTAGEMAADYRHLYKQKIALRTGLCPERKIDVPRVGFLVASRDEAGLSATLFDRWRAPLRHPSVAPLLEAGLVEPRDLIENRFPRGPGKVLVVPEVYDPAIAAALLRYKEAGVMLALDAALPALLQAGNEQIAPPGDKPDRELARVLADRILSQAADGSGTTPVLDERSWLWAAEARESNRRSAALPARALSLVTALDRNSPDALELLLAISTAGGPGSEHPWRLLVIVSSMDHGLPDDIETLVPDVVPETASELAAWLADSPAADADLALALSDAPAGFPPLGPIQWTMLKLPCLVSAGNSLAALTRSVAPSCVVEPGVDAWIRTLRELATSPDLLRDAAAALHAAALDEFSLSQRPERLVNLLLPPRGPDLPPGRP